MRLLPIVPLYQEGIAAGDAIGYVRDVGDIGDVGDAGDVGDVGDTRLEKSSYKILYPAYCTYIAGEGPRWVRVQWWVSYAVTYAAVIPGYIVGRIKAATVEEQVDDPAIAQGPR